MREDIDRIVRAELASKSEDAWVKWVRGLVAGDDLDVELPVGVTDAEVVLAEVHGALYGSAKERFEGALARVVKGTPAVPERARALSVYLRAVGLLDPMPEVFEPLLRRFLRDGRFDDLHHQGENLGLLCLLLANKAFPLDREVAERAANELARGRDLPAMLAAMRVLALNFPERLGPALEAVLPRVVSAADEARLAFELLRVVEAVGFRELFRWYIEHSEPAVAASQEGTYVPLDRVLRELVVPWGTEKRPYATLLSALVTSAEHRFWAQDVYEVARCGVDGDVDSVISTLQRVWGNNEAFWARQAAVTRGFLGTPVIWELVYLREKRELTNEDLIGGGMAPDALAIRTFWSDAEGEDPTEAELARNWFKFPWRSSAEGIRDVIERSTRPSITPPASWGLVDELGPFLERLLSDPSSD